MEQLAGNWLDYLIPLQLEPKNFDEIVSIIQRRHNELGDGVIHLAFETVPKSGVPGECNTFDWLFVPKEEGAIRRYLVALHTLGFYYVVEHGSV